MNFRNLRTAVALAATIPALKQRYHRALKAGAGTVALLGAVMDSKDLWGYFTAFHTYVYGPYFDWASGWTSADTVMILCYRVAQHL